MGLDMYIKIRKSEYKSTFRGEQVSYPAELDQAFEGNYLGMGYKSVLTTTDYKVGYWRKANAIHKWFVDNCAEGEDDCREMEISVEQLKELYSLCLQVMIDMSRAPELLPTCEGFFFGSEEYDEDYRADIEYTANLLQKMIPFLEEYGYNYTAIYQASW